MSISLETEQKAKVRQAYWRFAGMGVYGIHGFGSTAFDLILSSSSSFSGFPDVEATLQESSWIGRDWKRLEEIGRDWKRLEELG
jgi:hypothetical protein